jgi:hypothetical protein
MNAFLSVCALGFLRAHARIRSLARRLFPLALLLGVGTASPAWAAREYYYWADAAVDGSGLSFSSPKRFTGANQDSW